MTREEYLKEFKTITDKMFEITKAKNSDYTGTSGDPFKNFKIVEDVGICSAEQGFMTRMMDKMARINSFMQKGSLEVKDENVEDTLLDLANYSILFRCYLKSKRATEYVQERQCSGIL